MKSFSPVAVASRLVAKKCTAVDSNLVAAVDWGPGVAIVRGRIMASVVTATPVESSTCRAAHSHAARRSAPQRARR